MGYRVAAPYLPSAPTQPTTMNSRAARIARLFVPLFLAYMWFSTSPVRPMDCYRVASWNKATKQWDYTGEFRCLK